MVIEKPIKSKIEKLFMTRKNKNIWVHIYQECDYGWDYWFLLEEYKHEEIQKEFKENKLLELNFKNYLEYLKDGQKIIGLEID